jgi:thiamine biosynthesis lipoprotein
MKITAIIPIVATVIATFIPYYNIKAESLQPPERLEYKKIQMAVPVRLVFYADTSTEEGKKRADAAAQRVFDNIERLKMVFSDYESDSELRKACVAAQDGSEVPISDDLWTVLVAAKKYHRLSNGAFDPTVANAVRLWRRAVREEKSPKRDKLEEARALTDFNLVVLNEKTHTMRFLKKGVRLDLGGIAKGYIIDKSLELLKELGYPAALVDIGGDVAVGDAPPCSDDSTAPAGWKIGILDQTGEKVKEFKYLTNCVIATSGANARFVVIDSIRYSHIIDPKTGIGLTNSVVTTVIAPTAMDADAWASARSVNPELPSSVWQLGVRSEE